MRVLVTGATGFIGRHTATRLRANGHEVRALVRDRERAKERLADLAIADGDLVVGDMTDRRAVDRALEGCDAAVHAAAAVSVTSPGAGDAFESNVFGAKNVLGGASERGLQNVIFVSSATAIFDPHAQAPTTGDSPLVASATRYGRSKVESERFARELQAAGAPISIVYPSGVIGPDDPGLSESVRAYRSFLRGTIRAGATQFVDARDLAELHVRMLEEKFHGRLVAAGHYSDWDALTALLEDVTGATISRIRAPGWALRSAGGVADLIGRLTGKTMLMGREAMEVATRWRMIDDSPEIARLGVAWRDPRETLEDMFRWFLAAGRLPARAVPKLARPEPG